MTAPKFTLDELRVEIEAGTIDTVMVAFTDMQGRLQGKRLHAHYFLDYALKGATEGCNYLLTVDVDMNTIDGYEMTSWERGYGDFLFELDLSTLRRTPAEPTCAMIQCDLAWLDGSGRVRQAPRSVLLAQVERATAAGWTAFAGTELVQCLRGDVRAGVGQAIRRDDAREPLQHRLLGARWEPG